MRPLNRLLRDAVGQDDILRAARAKRALRRWREVVGDAMAERSQPDRFQKGTVWVAVRGSAWAQELRMIRETILERLNELAGEKLFLDVRFGVRSFDPWPVEDGEAQPEPIEEPKDELRELTIREIAERRLKKWKEG